MGIRKILACIISCCLAAPPLLAGAADDAGTVQTYRSEASFLATSFNGDVPEKRMLWVTGALRDTLRQSTGWEPPLRVPYWQRGLRTAWILEEIGKDRPITAGVVIDAGTIQRVEVLVFRESRGWEIRFPFFTDQFRSARLTPAGQLDHRIDGITGATLSVRAMKRMASAALRMDAEVRKTHLSRR